MRYGLFGRHTGLCRVDDGGPQEVANGAAPATGTAAREKPNDAVSRVPAIGRRRGSAA